MLFKKIIFESNNNLIKLLHFCHLKRYIIIVIFSVTYSGTSFFEDGGEPESCASFGISDQLITSFDGASLTKYY